MLNSQGEIKTKEFLERVTDYEKVFISVFEQKIINAIGSDKWAIEFLQFSIYSETVIFFADMYLDDISLFNPIRSVLENGLKELKHLAFNYYHRGDLQMLRLRYQQ
jgi:hypothetical protein